jgi:hypothetical protein
VAVNLTAFCLFAILGRLIKKRIGGRI